MAAASTLYEDGHRKPVEKAALPQNQGYKLFIGGLSWNTTDESMRQYLETQFGDVESAIIMRKPDGASRGFGFVIFKTETAMTRMLACRDMELDGRRIDAKPAVADRLPPSKEREDRMNARKDDRKYGREDRYSDRDHHKIFVGQLQPDITGDDLRQVFSQFGPVVSTVVQLDRATNRSRGFGFVVFTDEKSVENCLSSSGVSLGGHKLAITRAVVREKVYDDDGRTDERRSRRHNERRYDNEDTHERRRRRSKDRSRSRGRDSDYDRYESERYNVRDGAGAGSGPSDRHSYGTTVAAAAASTGAAAVTAAQHTFVYPGSGANGLAAGMPALPFPNLPLLSPEEFQRVLATLSSTGVPLTTSYNHLYPHAIYPGAAVANAYTIPSTSLGLVPSPTVPPPTAPVFEEFYSYVDAKAHPPATISVPIASSPTIPATIHTPTTSAPASVSGAPSHQQLSSGAYH